MPVVKITYETKLQQDPVSIRAPVRERPFSFCCAPVSIGFRSALREGATASLPRKKSLPRGFDPRSREGATPPAITHSWRTEKRIRRANETKQSCPHSENRKTRRNTSRFQRTSRVRTSQQFSARLRFALHVAADVLTARGHASLSPRMLNDQWPFEIFRGFGANMLHLALPIGA